MVPLGRNRDTRHSFYEDVGSGSGARPWWFSTAAGVRHGLCRFGGGARFGGVFGEKGRRFVGGGELVEGGESGGKRL